MSISSDAAAARESARQADGTFGNQDLPEPGVGSLSAQFQDVFNSVFQGAAEEYANAVNGDGGRAQVRFLHGLGVPAEEIASAMRAGTLEEAVQAAVAKHADHLVDQGWGDLAADMAAAASWGGDGTYRGKTAEEWLDHASQRHRQRDESWERSDTDGHLTQWAADVTARESELKARVADRHGRWTFPDLVDAKSGAPLGARVVHGRFGDSFAIDTPDGTRWVNVSEAKSASRRAAHYAKKGVKLVYVDAEATVVMSDGLSPTPFCVRTRDSSVPSYVIADDSDEAVPDFGLFG